MRLRILIPVAVAVAVVLVPGVADAKVVPSSGTIVGEELAAPIHVGVESGPGAGDVFMRLVEQAGFFAATMGLVPDPMSDRAPTTDLGPELVVTWQVDEHGAGAGALRQLVYPDAAGGPVTYTEPGQEFFDGMVAPGGWYRSPAGIVGSLTAVGVPVDRLDGPPPVPGESPSPRSLGGGGSLTPTIAAIAGVAIAVGAAVIVMSRRRVRMAHQ